VHCEPENVFVTTLQVIFFQSAYSFLSLYFISEALLTVLFVSITEELEIYMEVYCRCHYMTGHCNRVYGILSF